jgi:SAM-dependent methyltransferase
MKYTFPDCLCGGNCYSRVFLYRSPPKDESRFKFGSSEYRREVKCCKICGHYVSVHDMDIGQIYKGEYVNSTYGNEEGMLHAFERIVALPSEKSDNSGRVSRVVSFVDVHFPPDKRKAKLSVLDVGSGLCVFLYRMKEHCFSCIALDPDERAVRHAKEQIGVKTICSDFMKAENLGRFDVITFNKVLEHFEDPISVLAKSRDFLSPGGFVYIELPDGEAAEAEGPQREEFFIEHHHIFSGASTAILSQRAGFMVKEIERLREPSTKFTLRAFLVLPDQVL